MSVRYRYIRDLRPDITDKWRINVMVARAWNTSNPKTGRVFSLDFVLVDEQGSSIHAKVPLDLMKKYKNIVKEGCIYKINNLKVLAYSTFYRPLKREHYVEFFVSTFAQPSTIGQQLFPRYVFEFVQFDQLYDRIDDDTYLTDVIGVLREWGPLDSHDESESRNRKLRKIVIVDTGDVKLNITLWGESALKYPDDLIQTKKDTNIIVVLTGCKVRRFGGLPQVSTSVASQFHLNPSIMQVATYSQRPIHPVVFTSAESKCEDLTITSIPEIYKRVVDGVDVGTKFIIEAIVVGVDLSKDWKYIQCNKCLRTVQFIDVRYYCDYCKRNVQVLDNKELMHCVLFNTDATNLLGYTVDELITKDSIEVAADPNWIVDFFIDTLCGVPVVFGIKIDKYNLQPDFSRRFTVSKYYGPKLDVLKNLKCTNVNVLPSLLPVAANPPSNLDSETVDYNFQSKVTEHEENLMDEIQWGPRVTSTNVNDAPTMDSRITNEKPLNNIDESSIVTNINYSKVGATMKDKDKIINDAHDSNNESTVQDIEVGGAKVMLESA